MKSNVSYICSVNYMLKIKTEKCFLSMECKNIVICFIIKIKTRVNRQLRDY